jgi:hypothetical protein
LTRQRSNLLNGKELSCTHQVNRQRDQFEASDRNKTNYASRRLCAVPKSPNLGDHTRLDTTYKRARDSSSTKSNDSYAPCLSCSSLTEIGFFNISHRTLLAFIGKLICVRVRAALGLEFVVAVVCPRKDPRQNRADKITNDKAASLLPWHTK